MYVYMYTYIHNILRIRKLIGGPQICRYKVMLVILMDRLLPAYTLLSTNRSNTSSPNTSSLCNRCLALNASAVPSSLYCIPRT